MRTIKFRAWHKHEGWSKDGKPLEPGFEYDFWINSKGEISFPEGGWDITSVENKDIYFLQQYTGLKDKNGKEIYEGDIVQTSEGIREITWNQLHNEWALFEDGGMKEDITADWILDDGTTPKQWEVTDFEVIGHIYQTI